MIDSRMNMNDMAILIIVIEMKINLIVENVEIALKFILF